MVKRTAAEAALPEDLYNHHYNEASSASAMDEAAKAFWAGLEATVAGAYTQNFEHFVVLRSTAPTD